MKSTGIRGENASAAAFMLRLRHDHSGLSRMLRAIDGMVDRLTTEPAAVQPFLVEAFAYLLDYQHGYHHPREDRLFEKIRARRPALADTLSKLAEEHESGERETAELTEVLSAATPDQLRGRKGERLATRIHGYIQHARLHMRDEEAVFYARAEQVLRKTDWAEIIDKDGHQDPLADIQGLACEYPELAAHFNLTTRHLGRSETGADTASAMHRHVLGLTDLYGGLLHEGFNLTRRNARRLLAVRGPLSLANTVGKITCDNLRFAGQCLSRPSRWALNSGTELLTGRDLKPAKTGPKSKPKPRYSGRDRPRK